MLSAQRHRSAQLLPVISGEWLCVFGLMWTTYGARRALQACVTSHWMFPGEALPPRRITISPCVSDVDLMFWHHWSLAPLLKLWCCGPEAATQFLVYHSMLVIFLVCQWCKYWGMLINHAAAKLTKTTTGDAGVYDYYPRFK
ncbi:unnamed protein product [Pleuronectes platessa]|uniref:Uncharacterized protein n=1 Tax=Pleuronectes platessa TaxID=8262 RepID=A0A9N7UIJ0_PLEPL|nr:unnamed protein product [Pleuronectes platessa]